MKKTNYSYAGIAFIILVFGIIFIPRIIDRIKNGDITRSDRMSSNQDNNFDSNNSLAFLEINGARKKAPKFSFINQDSVTVSNRDYEGKVYLVEFFFTTCPSICPKMSANLVQIENAFKDHGDFGIASFTITPKIDTPVVLKNYAASYNITNPNWHFLTGDKSEIYTLANQGFGLYAGENYEAEGGFEHSGNFALIDKNGFLRSRYDNFGNPKIFYKGIISESEKMDEDGEMEEISMLKEDIKKLLNE